MNSDLSNIKTSLLTELELGESSGMVSDFNPKEHLDELYNKYAENFKIRG